MFYGMVTGEEREGEGEERVRRGHGGCPLTSPSCRVAKVLPITLSSPLLTVGQMVTAHGSSSPGGGRAATGGGAPVQRNRLSSPTGGDGPDSYAFFFSS